MAINVNINPNLRVDPSVNPNADVIANAPVADLQRKVPQAAPEMEQAPAPEATPTAEDWSDLLVEPTLAAQSGAESVANLQEGITAGLEREAELEGQREAERVQPLGDRFRQEGRVDKWSAAKDHMATVDPNPNMGIFNRAKNMATMVESREFGFGLRDTANLAADPTAGSLVGALTRSDAITPERTIDPSFLHVASAVTENGFAKAIGIDEELTPEQVEQQTVARARGNAALGQEIHREYMRLKNSQAGLPTDQYQDISREEATTLGDAMKEAYYQANKDIMDKVTDPKTGQSFYKPNRAGVEAYRAGKTTRQRMFPPKNVQPSKVKPQGGQLTGEARQQTKRSTGVVGEVTFDNVLRSAAYNLSQVPNVVDKQRLKIQLATILPVLSGEVGMDSWEAEINQIGQKKMNEFIAAEKKDMAVRAKAYTDKGVIMPGDAYNANANMESLRDTLAQQVRSIAQNREGANYLTYQIHGYNGRMDPQQTYFNPTASKAVRFVTRNAVPAPAVPGSRVERNLRQMYAVMLVSDLHRFTDPKTGKVIDADALLPDQRDAAVTQATPKMRQWGQRLQQVLDQTISDDLAEQAAEAIAQGMPLSDPNFPKIPPLALDPQQDAELIKYIKKKGEDGPHFIDGLIDFANYAAAKDAGKPYYSYFNAYIDGKTNGLASNGIQMGNENIARRTGVIRDNRRQLLDEGDLRDQLKGQLLGAVEAGPDGAVGEYYPQIAAVSKELFSIRNLNKATTMTYGYGMELNSMKRTLSDYLGVLEQDMADNPEFTTAMQILKDNQPDYLDIIHGMYAQELQSMFGQNEQKARAYMRSAALFAAMTDNLFTIKSYTGTDLNFGAEQILGQTADTPTGAYTAYDQGKRVSRQVPQYQTKATAAAPTIDVDPETGVEIKSPGQKAYGGSIPGPVQSLDAATVAMTSSGKSWKKLTDASKGNPYLHTIFDAFKMDAMGYDVVMDEVNANWLKATGEWSYLEEASKSHTAMMKAWNQEMSQRNPNEVVNLSEGGEFQMIGHLLAADENGWTPNLKSRLAAMMVNDMNMAPDDWNKYVNKQVNFIRQGLVNKKQFTVRDVMDFVTRVQQVVELDGNLARLINTTNKAKADLLGKIKREGHKVYQYYAH